LINKPATLSHQFIKGLLKGLLYYLIAAVVTLLVYRIFGWGYKHAPGYHHLTAFLFFLGGAGWVFHSCRLLLAGRKYQVNFGLLSVHVVFVLGIVVYVIIS